MAPGISTGTTKQVKTPVWVWERRYNGEGLDLYYADHKQEIDNLVNSGRTTNDGSKIANKMHVCYMTPYRDSMQKYDSTGKLNLNYFDGYLTVQSRIPVYDFATDELLNGAVLGDLYYVGYFYKGVKNDSDYDCIMTMPRETYDLGPTVNVDGENKYAYTYYAMKHLTELRELQVRIKGADKALNYSTNHNLNTYYAMARPGGGDDTVHYFGGDGTDNLKQTRFAVMPYDVNLEPGTDGTKILSIQSLAYYAQGWGFYIMATAANPLWTAYGNNAFYLSAVEDGLGYYDDFKAPGVYIIFQVDRYKVDDDLYFSGYAVLGGPTHG